MRLHRRLGLLLVPVLSAAALSAPAASAEQASATRGPEAAANADRGHRQSHGPDGLHLDRRADAGTAAPAGPTVVAESVDGTLTGSWDASNPLPVERADQPDRFAGLPSVHLVYLYPADLRSPRTQFLNMFEADARAAQAMLLKAYGRSIRFDERVDGRLDITVVRSAYKTRQLGSNEQFELVRRDLNRVFPDSESPRKKYIAWLDAPSTSCGQGEIYGDWHRDVHNWNDLRTTGVVYRPYSSKNADGGFCRGRTLLHELGHNLGAVYGEAPNEIGFHCNDDKNDVLCYASQVTSGTDTSSTSPGQFDYGNDDYWDAGALLGSVNGGPKTSATEGAHRLHLNWWTVNLSRFICRPYVEDGVIKPADCGVASAVYPTADEFRYHSGDETNPPPSAPPTT